MRKIVAALLLAGATLPAVAQTGSGGSPALKGVIEDHWRWWLSVNPVEATGLGVRDYDDRIDDLSLAARDANAKTEKAFLSRLEAIPDSGLSADERTNKAVLSWMLGDDIEANRHGERMMLFTTYYGWQQGFADMADNLPFYTRADYESYLKRLSLFPAQNGQGIAITKRAVKEGYVQPCSVLGGFADTISATVAGKPEDTRFYGPFLRNRPRDMSEADWTAMKARAVTVIRDVVTPEYVRLHDYIAKDYVPHCRKTDGASAMPGGAAWYATQVKAHTTTGLTPDQIHAIGLSEVKRILLRMDEVAKKAGYADRAAFIATLRTDPKYYAKTPQELLNAAAWQAKTIDGMLPRYFGRLPRLPYGVRAIPAETAEGTTTAYYGPGAPESGISGTYFVNTSKLSQRPLWELPALTAHEAVPGHHNQIALQQELDLPDFRKHAAGFTAYVEGWALYTEYLGEEMGLYDTPEKMMGRLSYEMWRACRLVVDTGIHAKGWTKAQAVAFMKENSALSEANIDAEVNRYISWPGQALGYKLGEIRIRELRAKAEEALGPKFDLRVFHDAVLAQGSVPLDVLSGRIDAWIVGRKQL
ncbi:DUF885 domain-containing protein [Sphingobium phenoxybenzoativorans]|uniref:DUF885 domain-containing protein n=1 Tax=Sphingobium phenoxybenzoativorans TaxID=1592790 RepID=A0A975Q289_9SPHN|nr:DUF885 domain-containing protein [Sphingobium phenoxybenzoativorans]QUT06431.1 DUF885 domain-containing protein [Sphingobium phenoxybenzoativorans]